jgi:site-specific recombinase XerD
MDLAPQGGAVPALAEEPPTSQSPYLVYLATLDSDESRRAMAGCLDRIVVILHPATAEIGQQGIYFPWGNLRYQHTAAIRAALQRQESQGRDGSPARPWSASYVNKHLSALRGVMEQAWMLGQMSAEDFHRAKAVKNVKGHRVPVGRSIASPEIRSLLAACLGEGTLTGTRDAAIVAVFHSTGLRREELAMASRPDYDPGARTLLITGKGNKQRDVYVHEDAAVYLGMWLSATGPVRVPLFCPVSRWGQLQLRHMSPRAVGHIIDRRRRAAQLPHIAPHDFRRTFAGTLLDEGVDLVRVQQLMGHSSPVTTSLYDRRPGRARKAAVDKLHLPSPGELAKPRSSG